MKAIAKLFYLDVQHADRAKQNGNIIWFTDSKNKHTVYYHKVIKSKGHTFDCYFVYKENLDAESAQDYYEDGMADKTVDAVFEEAISGFPGSAKGLIPMNRVVHSYVISSESATSHFLKMKKA